jgi:uncharacterized protein (TIGR03437 family)
MVFIAILVGVLVSAQSISAAALERIPIDRAFFFYEQNAGQADPAVRFLVRGVPTPTHLTADSISLTSGYVYTNVVVRFAASGAAPNIRSLEAWPGTLNRFEGDSKRWLRAIPAHRRVQYTDIHPGVDLILREARGLPSFTFVVRPGGDVNSLFLEASSFAPVNAGVDPQGNWSVSAAFGSWGFSKPRARQESATGAQIPLEARFVSSSTRQVRFQAPTFDRTRPLYIDVDLLPGLSSPYSIPYPAGSFAVDASNNVYLSGSLSSSLSCGTNSGGGIIYCTDAFVAAIRPSGEPIFLTVLAGSLEDSVSQLALESASSVIVAGNTTSADFPVTPGAFQPANAGPLGPMARRYAVPLGDLFLARIHPRSGDLSYSTFFGGPDGDTPTSLALGRDGSVTVLASVGSGFPATAGAWIRSSTCQSCNAVVRFDAALARPLFSSFLPDVFGDAPVKMAVHTDSSVYLAGSARAGAPTTTGALQPDNGGESDAYIVRLAPDGSGPLFASYFGGTGADILYSLGVDSRGDAWLYGETWERPFGQTGQTGWLTRVQSDGSRVVSSEFFPGGRIRFTQLLFDADGGLLLSGSAYSPALPTTAGALLPAGCGNSFHSFLEQRDVEGAPQLATYLPAGLSGILEFPAPGLAVAPSGDVYRGSRNYFERIDLHAPARQLLACVTGAASRRNSGRVAPGQIITLVGSGLGPGAGVSADPTPTVRYPTSLAGVRVLVDNTPAPLLYVQASQINAVVPYSIAPGKTVDVTAEYEGRVLTARVDAVRAEFSLFTADTSGSGQAAALNEDGTLNSPSNPARRGSIIVLYGTGAGVTIPPSADGALAPVVSPDALPKPVGQIVVPPGVVVYAGAAPGLVNGVTQINVRISEAAPAGDNGIGVFIDGAPQLGQSGIVTIAVQ